LEKNIFSQKLLPTIGFYHAGMGFYSVNNEYVGEDKARDFLFSEYHTIVFKLDSSFKGRGVYVFDKENFSVEVIKRLGTGIFQFFIEPHEKLIQLNKYSVATLRVNTVNNCGNVKYISSHLRASYSTAKHLGADDNLVCIAIDQQLNPIVKAFDSSFNVLYKHPNSNVIYEGFDMPSLVEAINTVKNLHKNLPFVHSIGWDIVIDKNNKIFIIEFNAIGNGTLNPQLFYGPVYKYLNWERFANSALQKPLSMRF